MPIPPHGRIRVFIGDAEITRLVRALHVDAPAHALVTSRLELLGLPTIERDGDAVLVRFGAAAPALGPIESLTLGRVIILEGEQ